MENWRDVKAYTISDFFGWYERGGLHLSPKYQRNSVWDVKAKSYLIDTILRGLTVPPIFLRQQVDFSLQKINREVIDGQQRLRAIIGFRENEFSINKAHNKEYAEMFYDDLPDEAKEQFLSYSLAVEIIRTTDDSIIYDIFARLNSNNYTLNHQEKRNAKFHGYFKVLAYQMAKISKNFFIEINLFNETEFSRMKDVEWVSKFLIFLLEQNYHTVFGKPEKVEKYIDEIYTKYDNDFPNISNIEFKYIDIINYCRHIFRESENIKFFAKPNNFFMLFMALSYLQLSQNQLDRVCQLVKEIETNKKNIFDNLNTEDCIDLLRHQISEKI